MARTNDPHSATSQFFINVVDNPSFDFEYTVFGQVLNGMDVVDRIAEGDTIEIMTGTFDRPDRLVPTLQFGTESRLGWVGSIAALASRRARHNRARTIPSCVVLYALSVA